MTVQQLAEGAGVRQVDRLAADAVVCDSEEAERDPLLTLFLDYAFRFLQVDISLERVLECRVPTFLYHQVGRHTAVVLHLGAGGVEVGVTEYQLPLAHQILEQVVLRSSALVTGDNVPVAENIQHCGLEVLPVAALCVGLVAPHHSRPLVVAHGGSAAVGQHVDQDQLARDLEHVVSGAAQRLLTLLTRGPADRLYNLYPEGL